MTPGSDLEALWSAALDSPPGRAFRTTAAGVHCADGELLVAVDAADRRVLLVPIASRQSLREDIDGRAVVLRRRNLEDETSYQSYASLELVDGHQVDLFTALVLEVLQRIATEPAAPLVVLRNTLADWRALLDGPVNSLQPSELAGLFGELRVLKELLVEDAGAVGFWTGPNGAAQDFHRGSDAIEVKASTALEGHRARINGLDQLELSTPGRLVLRWFRLRVGTGTSVPSLVDELLGRVDDVQAFRRLLAAYGYREIDRDMYARREFEVVEERAYEVGPGFPRITAACLIGDAVGAGIGPVEYVLDLASGPAEAARLDPESLARFMENR